jgi:ABC-2 type transport system permease protein
VNWQHFSTFLWLRWRLLVRQMKRAGAVNAVVTVLLVAFVALLAAGLFISFLMVGLFALPDAPPEVLMYVWDGLAAAFLFFWMMGLLVDLQRSEVLSLDKFLHFPVSLTSAFLINYLSSWLSVSVCLVVPAMVALALGLIIVKGPALLLQFLLLAGFLLMVTALSYQFQGWLASLMTNPRRRRTVIVFVTMGFVLLFQLPNLVNILRPWETQREDPFVVQAHEQQANLQRAFEAHEISQQELFRRQAELQSEILTHQTEQNAETLSQVQRTAWIMNLVLPPGWLPLGVESAARGEFGYALLGTLGMVSIGAFSLWRAYRTTLRLYTGDFRTARKQAVAVAAPVPAALAAGHLLERTLPGLSDRASAVALGAFRSLLRAPEAKMMLLTPILMVLIFGSMFFTRRVEMPEMVRPLVVFGTMTVILVSMGQLIGNQFGLDRGGFRVYVLSAAPRRDILLGKNLAMAPIVLGLGLFMVGLVEIAQRLRLEHLLATIPQMIAMYLIFCLVANLQAILAPMAIRAGSFKPVNPRAIPVLIQMAFALFCPILFAPMLLPLGIEFVLERLDVVHGVPVCLLLSVLECIGVIFLYRLVLPWEGNLLQGREQKILEQVASKAE